MGNAKRNPWRTESPRDVGRAPSAGIRTTAVGATTPFVDRYVGPIGLPLMDQAVGRMTSVRSLIVTFGPPLEESIVPAYR